MVASKSQFYPALRSSADLTSLTTALAATGWTVCRHFPAVAEALLALAARIGSPDLGVDQDLSGPPIMHLRHDPARAAQHLRPSYFSSDAFPLHTDMSYVKVPPRYLFMLCVTPDRGGGGQTVLSDCAAAWNELSAAEQHELEQAQFRFRNPPGAAAGDDGLTAVSFFAAEQRLWRFRRDGMAVPDPAEAAVDAFGRALERHAHTLRLDRGDLIIVDNHRVTHGRTAFAPTDLAPRHLMRTYAQDARRL